MINDVPYHVLGGFCGTVIKEIKFNAKGSLKQYNSDPYRLNLQSSYHHHDHCLNHNC